ncbi:PilN domain-containing protein [Pseudidiomarina andamanensis]|uniref:MSHA biogenesis protein MshI n=1 Tax=Pseudidiomarina andamanensis TaxID=1940690 RepID=A0AA92EU21_9GAMM|nr:PilN domain-containing protein [Pseudidiomarina andamanensis]MDS0217535.1 PilN domain-containing protein [Pseudidiomarina andamanensis]QGT96532.1 hypothetical protein D3795_10355 [Pseudidiomarina andamanensis]
MKQIANLYVLELRPNNETLTFKRVMIAVAAVLVIGIFSSVAMTLWANQAEVDTQRMAHSLSQAQQQLIAKQNELRAAMSDPKVAHQIEQIELDLGQRQRLLQQMQSVTQTQEASFAQVLEELARADTDAIWLQRILIANGQLTLQGRTADASALPLWLASFSNYDTLSGRQFGVFELRDEDATGVLDFTVGSLQHSSLLARPRANSGAAR